MPRIEYLTEVEYVPTFRAAKVAGMFDVSVAEKMSRRWIVDLPIEAERWSVGLIVGPSGSGKSTIARQAFGEAVHAGYEWGSKSFLDDFADHLSVTSIIEALTKVGFSSPPQWLLPYAALSTGQKFRAELARCLCERDMIVFDEFTSVVDRQVAHFGCAAMQKAVRAQNKRFVAVTCHYDVAEWLEPDWVLDMSTCEFSRRSVRRPSITIGVHRADRSVWPMFKGYHYLSADIHKSAKIFLAKIENRPVGMCAILPFPHPHKKNTWREHRLVTLPDYQGLGIGGRLSEAVGEILLAEGKMFISTTSHPSIIRYRRSSPKWRVTRSGHVSLGSSEVSKRGTSAARLSVSFEYRGEPQIDGRKQGTTRV